MSGTRGLLRRLASANPVPEHRVETLVDQRWRDELPSLIRTRGVPPATEIRAQRKRGRVALAAALAVVLLAAPAYAVGRTVVGWLAAEPAPPEVVAEFGTYARQLGFNPEPGKAVLVAEDEQVRLFATTNTQGGYCFIVSTRADGGTCVPRRIAAAPAVAAYVSNVAAPAGDGRLLVVVGRIRNHQARAVSFADPDGETVT